MAIAGGIAGERLIQLLSRGKHLASKCESIPRGVFVIAANGRFLVVFRLVRLFDRDGLEYTKLLAAEIACMLMIK